MIAENDIANFEKIVQAYRDAENAIEYEQKKLDFFESAQGTLGDSFPVVKKILSGTPTTVYFLKAADIIPIIEARLQKIKRAKNALKVPRLGSVTETED